MDCLWKEVRGLQTTSLSKSERSNRPVYLSCCPVLRQQYANCLMRGIWCRRQSNWSESVRRLNMCSLPFAPTILRLIFFFSPQSKYLPSTNSGGFSLIEVMVSVVVLSVAALGITSVWKLADDKALAARLDERATRILVEYSELQNF